VSLADHTARAADDPYVIEIADARAQAGFALRQLSHALIGREATIEDLRLLTDGLFANRARLIENPERSRLNIQESRDWSAVPADGEAMFSYDDRPISGLGGIPIT
jgi:hypothetical protein